MSSKEQLLILIIWFINDCIFIQSAKRDFLDRKLETEEYVGTFANSPQPFILENRTLNFVFSQPLLIFKDVSLFYISLANSTFSLVNVHFILHQTSSSPNSAFISLRSSSLILENCSFSIFSDSAFTLLEARDSDSVIFNSIAFEKLNISLILMRVDGLKLAIFSNSHLRIPQGGFIKLKDTASILFRNLNLTSMGEILEHAIFFTGWTHEIRIFLLNFSKLNLINTDILSINLSAFANIYISYIYFSECHLGKRFLIVNGGYFGLLLVANITILNSFIDEGFVRMAPKSSMGSAFLWGWRGSNSKIGNLLQASCLKTVMLSSISFENTTFVDCFAERYLQEGQLYLTNIYEIQVQDLLLVSPNLSTGAIFIRDSSIILLSYVKIINASFPILAGCSVAEASLVTVIESNFSMFFNIVIAWNFLQFRDKEASTLMKIKDVIQVIFIQASVLGNFSPISNLEFVNGNILISKSNITDNIALSSTINYSAKDLLLLGTSIVHNLIANGSCIFNNPKITYPNRTFTFKNVTFQDNNSSESNINLREDISLYFVFFAVYFRANHGDSLGGVIRIVRYNKKMYAGQFLQCLFERNRGSSGGVLTVATSYSHILFEKCIFLKNMADDSGGVLYFSSEKYSIFVFYSCYFFRNHAFRRGGAVAMPIGSYKDFDSVYENNYSEGASTFMAGSYGTLILTNSLIISSGPETKSVITALAALTLDITGLFFVNCSSTLLAIFNRAKASVTNCTVINSRVNKGPVFLVARNVDQLIKVMNTSAIVYNTGSSVFELRGGSLLIENFKMEGSGPTFLTSNMARALILRKLIVSGLIYKTLDSAFFIDSYQDQSVYAVEICTDYAFLTSKGFYFRFRGSVYITLENLENLATLSTNPVNFIYSLNSNLTILALRSLSTGSSCAVQAKESQLLANKIILVGPGLDRNQNANPVSVGVEGEDSSISILNSFFHNMTSAGVLSIGKKSILIVIKTKFVENTALFNEIVGGAGLRCEDSEAHIHECNFTNNQALEGGGGAVFLQATGRNFWTFSNNFFRGNIAHRGGGGAINWIGDLPPLLQSGNCFEGNKALFGNDIVSQAIKLLINSSKSEFNLKPGEFLPSDFLFHLSDFYGNRLLLKGRSRIIMDHIATEAESTKTSENEKKEVVYLIGESSVYSDNGEIAFRKIRLLAEPNLRRSFFIQTEMIKSFYSSLLTDPEGLMTQKNDYKSRHDNYQFLINITFSNCSRGEIFSSVRGACEVCTENYFSLNESDAACVPCFKNAYCPGGDRLILNLGYWRPSMNTARVYRCLSIYSCKGGENPNDQCYEGYSGPLCGICVKQVTQSGKRQNIYFMDIDRKCKICDEDLERRGIMIITFAVFIILTYLCIEIRDEINNPTSIRQVILKILTNHIQIVTIVMSSNDRFPNSFQELLNFPMNFGSPNQLMNTIGCGLNSVFIEYNIVFKKIVIFSAMSLLIPFQIFAFWSVIGILKKKPKGFISHRFLVSYQITFYLMQPLFITEFASPLVCIKIEGVSYMKLYLAEKCWGEMHLTITLYFCLPMLLLWFFFIPLLLFIFTRKYGKNPNGSNVFAFITSGYKKKYYFWDFVLMIKKMLLIVVVIAFNNTIISYFINLFIVFVSCFSQIVNKPYRKQFLNKLYIISNSVLFLSIAFLSLNVGLITALEIPFVFILINVMLLNAGFFLFWLKYYLVLYEPVMKYLGKCFGFKYFIDQFSGKLVKIESVEKRKRNHKRSVTRFDNYLHSEQSSAHLNDYSLSASNL